MMFLATLQLGKTGFFTEHGWFYLELLVLLFSIGAGVLWLIEKRRHRSAKHITPHSPMGSIPTHLLRTKAGSIGKTAIAYALVFLGGIAADQTYRHYTRDYAAWKSMAEEYNRTYAAWLAQHPQYQQDKVNK